MRKLAVLLVPALLLAVSCAPASRPDEAVAPVVEGPNLNQLNVVMAANPPPPFTYWAPEGSTIRNHPNVPGIWLAEAGGQSSIYFGDACHASTLQDFVGRPLASFEAPDGVEVRTFCTTCAHTDDLRSNRVNVTFDETTQTIASIACH